MKEIKVLDKGSVSYIDHSGSDLLVVNAARVSFNKESSWESNANLNDINSEKILSEKDKKLILYLAKHNHWTPFAHPHISLRIKAPISIRTQLFKHKVGFIENEISRRYVTFEPEIYDPNWRTRPINGAKQGSEDFMNHDDTRNNCNIAYQMTTEQCIYIYNNLLSKGVAPEQARFILPQGTYTEWYWTGSLAAYARVCKQRMDPHAQWEVQEYAKAISDIIRPLYPFCWDILVHK